MSKLTILGKHDEKTLAQIRRVAEHPKAQAAALMADGHLGYGMPIGGVVAYDNAVSPEGVGFDIGCGNKAVKTNVMWPDLRPELDGIMDRVFSEVAFGIGQASGRFEEHEVFEREEWDRPLAKSLEQQARKQLGSVGSGNHYVDLLVGSDEAVWIGVHFGSRGLGHKIASNFMADGDMMKPVTVLELERKRGEEYWPLMELAGAYAHAGRDCVCEQVANILGARIIFEIHNHHNYAWREDVPGLGEVVVVRKGATPAYSGQAGFVGGSMGDAAVTLVGSSEGAEGQQIDSLFSTIHGAGRVMSRTQARGKWKKGVQVKQGLVSSEAMRGWLDREGVILRGAGLDEAPQAYRRLPEVLAAQGPTVVVTETLQPVGVAMAGSNDFDPYKD